MLPGIGLTVETMKVFNPGGAQKLGYEAPASGPEFPDDRDERKGRENFAGGAGRTALSER
jgi:hypothetical protein